MLKDWINPKYLENIDSISNQFLSAIPFEHISLNDFLIESKADELLKAVSKLDYYLEDHDLYQFMRTKNISDEKGIIEEFSKFLESNEFKQYIEKITNVKTKNEVLDLHSLKLLDTHYLLPHDDQVEERALAFIFNLTRDFKKSDGGSLNLFESEKNRPKKIVKEIIPKFNQFNLFKVTSKSYHSISEVTSKKERITVAGWYYK